MGIVSLARDHYKKDPQAFVAFAVVLTAVLFYGFRTIANGCKCPDVTSLSHYDSSIRC